MSPDEVVALLQVVARQQLIIGQLERELVAANNDQESHE